MKKNERKCYAIIDKVREETLMYLQGNNEKAVVRELVLSGYFKVNRLKDTIIIECELPKEKCAINIEKALKELEISFEDKAEKIADTSKEAVEIIKKEVKNE